jgi:hypothetical protein
MTVAKLMTPETNIVPRRPQRQTSLIGSVMTSPVIEPIRKGAPFIAPNIHVFLFRILTPFEAAVLVISKPRAWGADMFAPKTSQYSASINFQHDHKRVRRSVEKLVEVTKQRTFLPAMDV